MKNIVVFDTETVSLHKPFCYNIGYVIIQTDGETFNTLIAKEFVVEQIWHNVPLFSTAYYAEKRPLYVSAMRGKRAKLEKFGKITREMYKDFTTYNVEEAYAYNSAFDEKVFNFNCEYFNVINPFDNIPILDIWAIAQHTFCIHDSYKFFCEENSYYTERGNYSTNAENVYRYLTDNVEFVEDHTALSDAEIESEILRKCVIYGYVLGRVYEVIKTIPREKTLEIKQNGETVFVTKYTQKTQKKDTIYLK